MKLRSRVLTATDGIVVARRPRVVGSGPSGGQLTALTVGTTRTASVPEELVEPGGDLVAQPLGGDVVAGADTAAPNSTCSCSDRIQLVPAVAHAGQALGQLGAGHRRPGRRDGPVGGSRRHPLDAAGQPPPAQ